MIAEGAEPICDTGVDSSVLLQQGKSVRPTSKTQSAPFIQKQQQIGTDSGEEEVTGPNAELSAHKDTGSDGGPKNTHAPATSAAVASGVSERRDLYSKIAAIIVGLMLLLAILPILWNNGLTPFVVVLVYLFSLIAVKFAVKETMSLGYGYPYTITAFHMLGSALAAMCFDRPGLSEALKVLPVSIANGVSLALNNTALLYGGVAFTSMVGSCAPAPTYLFEVILGRRSQWTDGFLGTLLVCIGSVLCVRGETTASLLCFALAAGATVCRALKSIAQQELLAVKVSPMVMIFWTGFWSFWLLVPVIAWTEGAAGLTSLLSIPAPAFLALLLSIACATMLNICQVFAVKQLGSLQQVTVGNLNCIMAIVLATAMRHEAVLDVQYFGTFLVMLGAPLSKKSVECARKPDAGEDKKTTDVERKMKA